MRQPRVPYARSKNVYWALFNDAGDIWDNAAMVPYGSGDINGYTHAMIDVNSIGDYSGTLPVAPAALIPNGKYRVCYFEQISMLGADISADPMVWVDEEFWIRDGVGLDLKDIAADNYTLVVES